MCVVSCDCNLCVCLQDYPKNRHPGWSQGSVAYHAGETWCSSSHFLCALRQHYPVLFVNISLCSSSTFLCALPNLFSVLPFSPLLACLAYRLAHSLSMWVLMDHNCFLCISLTHTVPNPASLGTISAGGGQGRQSRITQGDKEENGKTSEVRKGG